MPPVFFKNFFKKALCLVTTAIFLFASLVPVYAQANLWQTRKNARYQNLNVQRARAEFWTASQTARSSVWSAQDDRTLNYPLYNLPSNIGQVIEFWTDSKKNSGPVVIQIQDIHGNYGAQKNTAFILDYILNQKEFGFGSKPLPVYIEGAWQKVDPNWIKKSWPDNSFDAALESFLQKGIMTAEEYYALKSKEENKILIEGLEEKDLYQANALARKMLEPYRKKILSQLNNLDSQLESKRNVLYSKEMFDFQKLSQDFSNGKIGLKQYIQGISDRFLDRFTNIQKMKTLVKQEENLNLDSVQDRTQKIVKILSEKLSSDPQMQAVLSDASLKYRLGRCSALQYYKMLEDFAKNKNIEDPFFSEYVNHLSFAQTINHELLLKEISEYQRLNSSFLLSKKLDELSSEEKEELVQVYEKTAWINLEKKFWVEGFSPQAWKEYQTLKTASGYSKVAKEIDQNIPKDLRFFQESYYDLALKRDLVLGNNLIQKVEGSNLSSPVVFISGGFHTQGISRQLQARGISYLVIQPNIDAAFSETKVQQKTFAEIKDFWKKYKSSLKEQIKLAKQNDQPEQELQFKKVLESMQALKFKEKKVSNAVILEIEDSNLKQTKRFVIQKNDNVLTSSDVQTQTLRSMPLATQIGDTSSLFSSSGYLDQNDLDVESGYQEEDDDQTPLIAPKTSSKKSLEELTDQELVKSSEENNPNIKSKLVPFLESIGVAVLFFMHQSDMISLIQTVIIFSSVFFALHIGVQIFRDYKKQNNPWEINWNERIFRWIYFAAIVLFPFMVVNIIDWGNAVDITGLTLSQIVIVLAMAFAFIPRYFMYDLVQEKKYRNRSQHVLEIIKERRAERINLLNQLAANKDSSFKGSIASTDDDQQVQQEKYLFTDTNILETVKELSLYLQDFLANPDAKNIDLSQFFILMNMIKNAENPSSFSELSDHLESSISIMLENRRISYFNVEALVSFLNDMQTEKSTSEVIEEYDHNLTYLELMQQKRIIERMYSLIFLNRKSDNKLEEFNSLISQIPYDAIDEFEQLKQESENMESVDDLKNLETIISSIDSKIEQEMKKFKFSKNITEVKDSIQVIRDIRELGQESGYSLEDVLGLRDSFAFDVGIFSVVEQLFLLAEFQNIETKGLASQLEDFKKIFEKLYLKPVAFDGQISSIPKSAMKFLELSLNGSISSDANGAEKQFFNRFLNHSVKKEWFKTLMDVYFYGQVFMQQSDNVLKLSGKLIVELANSALDLQVKNELRENEDFQGKARAQEIIQDQRQKLEQSQQVKTKRTIILDARTSSPKVQEMLINLYLMFNIDQAQVEFVILRREGEKLSTRFEQLLKQPNIKVEDSVSDSYAGVPLVITTNANEFSVDRFDVLDLQFLLDPSRPLVLSGQIAAWVYTLLVDSNPDIKFNYKGELVLSARQDKPISDNFTEFSRALRLMITQQ